MFTKNFTFYFVCLQCIAVHRVRCKCIYGFHWK